MIEIVTAKRSKNGLHVKYRVNGEDHFTDFFYNSINFYQLEKIVGPVFVQRLFFHAVAFDVLKFVKDDNIRILWGPFFHFVSSSFSTFWERQANATLMTYCKNGAYAPTTIATNGIAPLTIDGSDEPVFTVSGRSRKAKDNHHHVQIKTSKKHTGTGNMVNLFLALPVAAAHGIATVRLDKKSVGGYSASTTDYIHKTLTPDITVA
jgi:hypothetical protein